MDDYRGSKYPDSTDCYMCEPMARCYCHEIGILAQAFLLLLVEILRS